LEVRHIPTHLPPLIEFFRGKGEHDETLHCSGKRACYLKRKIKNKRNQDVPEYVAQCQYHVISCLGDHEDDAYPPKIAVPNSEGLCVECYYHKHKYYPPKMTADMAPTVYDPNTSKPPKRANGADSGDGSVHESDVLGSVKDNQEDENGLTENSICCWVPTAEESLTNMRGHVCRNKVFRHPTTRVLLPTCAMHIRFCIKPHTESAVGGIIEIPNLYGLCNVHHVSEFGVAPLPVPWPYPGVERRLKTKGWMMIKTGHWAAPSWPPNRDVPVCRKKYRLPRKPDSYIDRMRETARILRFKR
jgi:hypothetical protein